MKNKQIAFWIANFKYFLGTYPTYRKIKKDFSQEAYEKYAMGYVEYILKKIKVTYELEGEENRINSKAFYVANHNSMFDSYFAYLAVKHRHSFFVAGDLEYSEKFPIFGNFMKWANCIFVDRSSLKSGLKSIKEAEKQLKKGNNLIIFPEGEITSVITEDKVGEFHAGSFKAAQKQKVPIVPITIIGSQDIHNTNSIFSYLKSGHVKIIIGEPILDFTLEEDFTTQEVAKKVRKIIIKTLEKN